MEKEIPQVASLIRSSIKNSYNRGLQLSWEQKQTIKKQKAENKRNIDQIKAEAI